MASARRIGDTDGVSIAAPMLAGVPEHPPSPLTAVIEHYTADLRRQGVRSWRNSRAIALRVARACGWQTVADIDRAAFEAWLRDAHAQGHAASTVNNALAVWSSLLDWLLGQGRVIENWVRLIPRSRGDRGDGARALTLEEVARLVAVARESERTDRRAKRSQRSAIYTLAAYTGLRGREIRALCVRHCLLDATPPRLALTAHIQKGRKPKPVEIPLHPQAYDVLAAACHGRGPDERVFATFPTEETFKGDLRRAGIPLVDGRGRAASFHSLRKSFVTALAVVGAGQRSTQALARHSDPRMTAHVYTDAALLPLAAELAKLPRLGEPLNLGNLGREIVQDLAPFARSSYGSPADAAMTTSTHNAPHATGLPSQAASATDPFGGLVAQGVSAAGPDLSKRAKGLEPSACFQPQGVTDALIARLEAVLAALRSRL